MYGGKRWRKEKGKFYRMCEKSCAYIRLVRSKYKLKRWMKYSAVDSHAPDLDGVA